MKGDGAKGSENHSASSERSVNRVNDEMSHSTGNMIDGTVYLFSVVSGHVTHKHKSKYVVLSCLEFVGGFCERFFFLSLV